MSGLTTDWSTNASARGFMKTTLVWTPGLLAGLWFAVCCAGVTEFGRVGFLLLARPSLYLGLMLFVFSIAAFWMVPRPRVRKDGFALALSLAGSAFTMISFAVASRIVG
ncbi:MAG: hypothetical protein K8I27_11870 [Planctomycetes bacterium]|nr:hypothetical protein [Planctomycetota bacterium]